MAQNWEYLVLRLDLVAGVYVPRYLNGEEIKGWNKGTSDLFTSLNHLGGDGWELVTSYREMDSLIFKRPKR